MKTLFYTFLFLFYLPLFAQTRPKLIVGVVVDQMSFSSLYKHRESFKHANGFKKLFAAGAQCTNLNYNYAPTFTGPGHASIYTGTTPNIHGIVANDWLDKSSGKMTNCVGDTNVQSVGSKTNEGKCSPNYMKSSTLGDQLKSFDNKSKVYSISIKDRSAILPAGFLSDGAFWYDELEGKFISSTFYMNQLPIWMNNFNNQLNVSNLMNTPWTLEKDLYLYKNQMDDSNYEQLVGGKSSPVFPYDFSQLPDSEKKKLFTLTPFANSTLTSLAQLIISTEQLGQDVHTDLFCLSYSSPDIAGHSFGPSSTEMEDMYLKLDGEFDRLIAFLEKTVGKNNFVLFVTADHGVVEVPQERIEQKRPGGYLYINEKLDILQQKVSAKFNKKINLRCENNQIYFDSKTKEDADFEIIKGFVQLEINNWNEITSVLSQQDLINQASLNPFIKNLYNGFDSKRCGDLILQLEPGYLTKRKKTTESTKGTSHGSPYNYDTHVPALFYGSTIKSQQITQEYDIIDICATIIQLCGIEKPDGMTGKAIQEICAKK